MEKSKLIGPFKPLKSGAIVESALEGFPAPSSSSRRKKGDASSVSHESSIFDEDAIDLLPSEEDYVRLQTLHLQEPLPFPNRTSDVRKSRYPDLYRLRNETGGYKKVDFYNKAVNFFRRKDDPLESKDLVQYADRLYRDYIKNHSLVEAITNLFYLLKFHHDIASSLERVMRNRFHRIATALIDPLFVHHDITPDQQATILHFIRQAVSGNLGEELRHLIEIKIESYVDVRSYATELKQRFARNHDALEALQPELAQMNEELMKGIRNLRRYGLKSSYYQDGFLHNDAQAWVVADIRDVLPDTAQTTRGIFAMISLSNKAELQQGGITEFDLKSDHISSRFESRYSSRANFFLKWDGELHDSNPDRHLFAREIFRRVGAEPEYEMLLSSLLARIHDLVVPVEHTRDLPPLGGLARAVNAPEETDEPFGRIIQHILTPRIQQGSDPRIRAGLEDDRRRDVREHDVKEFKRPLPPGHHPSPEAIALARAYDIVIDPKGNETFVKPHKRGRGGPGFIHELREE